MLLLASAGAAITWPAGPRRRREHACARLLLAAGAVHARLPRRAVVGMAGSSDRRRITCRGNPAGSFFYLLTAMHGLHVPAASRRGCVMPHACRGTGQRRGRTRALPMPVRALLAFPAAGLAGAVCHLAGLRNDLVRFICGEPDAQGGHMSAQLQSEPATACHARRRRLARDGGGLVRR